MELNMTYLSQAPSKWTFEQVKLKVWVESYCRGLTLNLFAGKTKLNIDEYRVDVSPEFEPDWCGDANKFLRVTKLKFGTVILDPPYSLRKSREKYQGKYVGSLTKIKNGIDRVLKQDARIISLGYDTVGMANRRGYTKIAICVVCHNGDHNDTLALVEEKTRWGLLNE